MSGMQNASIKLFAFHLPHIIIIAIGVQLRVIAYLKISIDMLGLHIAVTKIRRETQPIPFGPFEIG